MRILRLNEFARNRPRLTRLLIAALGGMMVAYGMRWLVPPWPQVTLPVDGYWRKLVFAPTGSTLLTINSNINMTGATFPVCLWDGSTGRLLAETANNNRVIRSVAFSPDSRQVAIVGADIVEVRNAADRGEVVCKRKLKNEGPDPKIAYRADGRLVLAQIRQTGSARQSKEPVRTELILVDALSGEQLTTIAQPSGSYSVYTDMNSIGAIGNRDGLRLFDATTGTILATVPLRPAEKGFKDFARSAGVFAVAEGDSVEIWSSRTGELQTILADGSYEGVALSPDGRFLAVHDLRPFVQRALFADWLSTWITGSTRFRSRDEIGIYELESGWKLATFPEGEGAVFSPDGETLAVFLPGKIALYAFPLGWRPEQLAMLAVAGAALLYVTMTILTRWRSPAPAALPS